MKKIFPQVYPISVDLLVMFSSISVYWVFAPSFSEEIFEMYATPALFWTDLFVVAVILLGLGCLFVGMRDITTFKSFRFFLIPLSGIVLLSVISTFDALMRPMAFYYALRLLFTYILFSILVTNKLDIKRVAWVFFLSMVCQAGIGLAQFVNRGPLGIPGEIRCPTVPWRILTTSTSLALNVLGIPAK